MVMNGGDGVLIRFLTLMDLVWGELLDKDGHLCQATILYEVGDATQVKFWQD